MAAQTVIGNVSLSAGFTETATLALNTSFGYPANLPNSYNFSYVNTTGGALGTNLIHCKQYTLAATTQTINLNDGSLLSLSGVACNFGRVREFVIAVVDTTSTHLLKVYSPASTGVLWLPPVARFMWATPNGGLFRMSDPNAITTAGYLVDGSNYEITFNAGSFTVIFDLLIVGNTSQA